MRNVRLETFRAEWPNPMASDDNYTGDAPADDSGMMGIVVQGRRIVQALPNLSFVWGPPEFQAAPSLPFGRWKPAVKAA